MTLQFEVSCLEKDIEAGNFNVTDRIANIRNFIFSKNQDQIPPKVAKTFALRIWDISIKIQKAVSSSNISNKSSLLNTIIPQMKLLTTDTYQEYKDQNDENDMFLLFYFSSYTYKSLINADIYSLAEKYFDIAFRIFPKLNPSANVIQVITHLKIWQTQYLILKNNNYNEALTILKEFTDQYALDLSYLLSFVYQKTIESKSLDWCSYCLQLANNSSTVSNEWKNQIKSLLAQFYLNNSDPENAMKLVSVLPYSINKIFLELKCIILLYPKERTLKQKLISFISETSEDPRVLIALCLFIVDHSQSISQVSIEFITEVMKISHTISDIKLRKHIYFSAIRISCMQDDINSAASFLQIISAKTNTKQISDKDRSEIAEILWNKALTIFDANEFEKAVQWMQCSRSQMSDIDDNAQSCCCRFIACCLFEAQKYEEALISVNNSIKRSPNCYYSYLLKFQILVAIGSENEAFELINSIINGSQYLKEFEPDFFTSIAAELHSKSNDLLALDTLLKLYELNFNLNLEGKQILSANEEDFLINIKKSVINSIFSLLQTANDTVYVFKAICTLSSHWNSRVLSNSNGVAHLASFPTSEELLSYSSVAFNNGVELKKKNLWEMAAKSFTCGSLFSNTLIELKSRCLFEAVDCYIRAFCAARDAPQSKGEFEPSSDIFLTNAQEALKEAISAAGSSIKMEEKIRDELSLAKVKIELAKMIFIHKTNNDENDLNVSRRVFELTNSLTRPDGFLDLCSLFCQFKVQHSVIRGFLERAKMIDQTSIETAKKEENDADRVSRNSLSACLVYKFLMKYVDENEEVKNIYEMLLELLGTDASLLMSSSQLQFFMSRAWNIGVSYVESMKLKDAEWWLKTSLTIMNHNDELKRFYESELQLSYSKLFN